MAEVKTLIDGKQVVYEGLFSLKELYRIIDKWFFEHGYDKQELKNYEDVSENEKQVILEILPYKKISDYAKIEIRIFMIFSKLQDVEVERNGVKVTLNKGRADFSFDCYLITDYEHKWETRPMMFFLRAIFDKYVYKIYTSAYEKEAVKDTLEAEAEIKAFLNLNRF
jgi:hypothetical protein